MVGLGFLLLFQSPVRRVGLEWTMGIRTSAGMEAVPYTLKSKPTSFRMINTTLYLSLRDMTSMDWEAGLGTFPTGSNQCVPDELYLVVL
ncbi:hypothetical protein CEXT_23251 [Caerostris extrusa]|uniref:Secreted protein n=1 Tax=Caerostris extrusa TaxID=172846 RepID=A0AAV4XVG6_CAEEX|nr:hypothetical protein CEXT_23251 [Caerostris extrusa]